VLSRLGMQRAHITRCLIVLTMILTALLATGTDLVSAQTPPTPAEGIVPGEILVKFNPGTSETKKKEGHRKKGGQTEEVIPEISVEVVQVPSGDEESRAVDYETDPNVQYAEPNGLYQAFETQKETTRDVSTNMTPTDSRVGEQWAYNNTGDNNWKNDADIDAFEAWDITTGSDTVPIAVLDTGRPET
jgi:thermitase